MPTPIDVGLRGARGTQAGAAAAMNGMSFFTSILCWSGNLCAPVGDGRRARRMQAM
jgi:hypothetical protein